MNERRAFEPAFVGQPICIARETRALGNLLAAKRICDMCFISRISQTRICCSSFPDERLGS